MSSRNRRHKPSTGTRRSAQSASAPALIVRPSREERHEAEDAARARTTTAIRSALLDLAGLGDAAESGGAPLDAQTRETLDATRAALSTLQGLTPDVLAHMPDLAASLADVARLATERHQEQRAISGRESWSQAAETGQWRRLAANGAHPPDLLIREAPTHSTPVASGQAAGWAGMGIASVRHDAMGVPNADYLRRLATANPWVEAAVLTRKQQIGRSDIAVLPDDPTESYDHAIQEEMEDLLNFPNEQKDSYRSLMEPVVDDILVLDRGCISKDLDARGVPHHLYFEDAATIRIFADWSGIDPAEPRYLFVPPGKGAPGGLLTSTNEGVPLTNDQLICIMANAASYRFGLAPTQILLDTIRGDLAATEKAMALVRDVPPPHLVNIRTSAGAGVAQKTVETFVANYDHRVAGKRELMVTAADDLQVYPLMFSLKDNQFLEWQLYLARKICAIFQISPQQIGITFDINKATAESQQQIFEDSGLVPLLLLLEEYLNREVLADFAPRKRGSGASGRSDRRPDLRRLNLRVVYPEVSELARMRHAERVLATAVSGLAGLPLLTPNMALEMLGQEPVGGGNTFWVNTTNGPLPWLSYDGETGAYGTWPAQTGDLGAQDPAGGVDEDERAPDDSTSEHADRSANPGGSGDGEPVVSNDSSGNGDAPNLQGEDNPVSAGSGGSPAAAAGGGGGAGKKLAMVRLAAAANAHQSLSVPAHLMRLCDARRAGRPWSPATDALTRERARHVARYGVGPDVDARAEIDRPLPLVRVLPMPPGEGEHDEAIDIGSSQRARTKAHPRSRGRVSRAVAERHRVPPEEREARATLAAAVEGIFREAESRGRHRMGA